LRRESIARTREDSRQDCGAKLVVLEAEDPWTREELNEVRNQLKADVKRLRIELDQVEGDLANLMRDAAREPATTPRTSVSATFERDQEMTIRQQRPGHARPVEHALNRIADRTYGICEVCGNPSARIV